MHRKMQRENELAKARETVARFAARFEQLAASYVQVEALLVGVLWVFLSQRHVRPEAQQAQKLGAHVEHTAFMCR